MKKILKEFQDFALKGNMIDLAVGVIIGGAFNGLVSSLVENVIMPVLSLFVGKLDFSNMFIAMNGEKYATLAQAKEVTSTLAYGQFLTEVINFVIMAFVVFIVVRQLNALYKKPAEPAAAPHVKVCPFCKSTIDLDATRCPHCTSELPAEETEAEAVQEAAASAE
ncbi:MAG TPA: large conductance mechanosensitive channel protein MscL [Candidatus Ventrimonas merdavium]|nr:large conductance mechanosensitive channel protein MscL [Candidatus Ventrimonas merdavium]